MDAYDNKNQNLEFYVQWHFIDSCNLRCIHCYQSDYNHKALDLNIVKSIFLKLDEAMSKWKMKCFVSLTGGEPFLQPEGLFYLMDLIEKSDNFKNMAILTNGTLLNEGLVKKIKGYKKLAEVQVSLDGHDEKSHDAVRGKGTFLKTVNSIKILKNSEIKTVAMFTLHKKNIESAAKMPQLAGSLNIDALTVERMTPMNDVEKDEFFIEAAELKTVYSDVYNAAKVDFADKNAKLATSRPLWNLIDEGAGGYCPIGLSSLCILYDGTLLPCRRLYLPLGNILTDGLFKVWYNSEILWKLRKRSDENECSGCSHIDRCGGCKAVGYYVNKNLNSKDPQCWI
ncbi:MAG: radical SAM protein [Deltaproteobacteria bacterium]|jgi:radical SAM protein with 4Fe4S-binding SPASM domain|nr:radical SAM protein [Deltaproteobacteria bacterium]